MDDSPAPRYPGSPPHPPPFLLQERNGESIARLSSGEELNLTHLVPKMARAAAKAEYPRRSIAASLRGLQRRGVLFTAAEWDSLMASALHLLSAIQESERKYVSGAEAARILSIPLSTLREFIETAEGRRALGYPVVIGEEVRVAKAALDPASRPTHLYNQS